MNSPAGNDVSSAAYVYILFFLKPFENRFSFFGLYLHGFRRRKSVSNTNYCANHAVILISLPAAAVPPCI